MEKDINIEGILGEDIMKILNDFDIEIDGGYVEGEYIVTDARFYSPLGEDVLIGLAFDGTRQGFVKGFRMASLDFDADDHAEMWIEKRGRNGVPSSIRELIDDAVWIEDRLRDTCVELLNLSARMKWYDSEA